VSNRNKQIIEQVNGAFAGNNLEGFLVHCADDVAWTIVGEKTATGKESIRQWMSGMIGGDAPVFNVATMIADGDLVMAHGAMTMTDENRKTVPYSYCDIYRFRGDKIVELTSFVVKTEGVAAA